MAVAKTRTSLLSGTLTAGTPQTSSWIDLSAAEGATINMKITNGGTGPTVAAQVQIVVANDYNSGSPSNPVNFGPPWVSALGNSVVSSDSISIDASLSAVQVTASGNTGQNVTMAIDIGYITGTA